MKAAKQFSTEHGQSQMPQNMHHTTATLISVELPFLPEQRVVVLHLEQQRAQSYVLKVRMSPDEARKLGEALIQHAEAGAALHTFNIV